MAAYLEAALEENDAALLATAIGDIARARANILIRSHNENQLDTSRCQK